MKRDHPVRTHSLDGSQEPRRNPFPRLFACHDDLPKVQFV
jgi:hypothetical protein